jgi:pyrroline-5-carboxylate reductase
MSTATEDAMELIQRTAMNIAAVPVDERDAMFAATRQLHLEACVHSGLDSATATRLVESTMAGVKALVDRLDFVGSGRA